MYQSLTPMTPVDTPVYIEKGCIYTGYTCLQRKGVYLHRMDTQCGQGVEERAVPHGVPLRFPTAW